MNDLNLNPHSASLFIGNLSIYCIEKDLFNLFSKYGNVQAVIVKTNSKTKLGLGYGFVRFSTREEAAIAMRELHGSIFMGREIR